MTTLITHYPFDSNAQDAVGTKHGTATGITYAAGHINNAALFDGAAGSGVVIPGGRLTADTQGALSMWLNLDSSLPESETCLFQYHPGYNAAVDDEYEIKLVLSYDGGTAKWSIKIQTVTDVNDAITVNHDVVLDTWFHLVVQSSGSAWAAYINGVEQALTVDNGTNSGYWIGDVPVPDAPDFDKTYIGNDYKGASPFKGMIDQFKLFDTALTAGEIASLYAEVYIPPVEQYITVYQCILTGAENSLDDLVLPISNFTARIKSAAESYLEVSVPNALDYIDEIALRPLSDIVVSTGLKSLYDGDVTYTERARANFEAAPYDLGPTSQTVRLSGHKTVTYSSPVTVALPAVSGVSLQTNGKRRVRCGMCAANPGDTVTWNDGANSMTVGMITLTVSVLQQIMDITEA